MATTSTRPATGRQPLPSSPGSGSGSGNGNGGRGGNGNGRRPAPRRRKRPRLFWRILAGLFWTGFWIVVAAVTVGAAYIAVTVKSMPSGVAQIEDYKPSGRTVIYSADGVMLASLFQQNRQPVTIDKIPYDLQNATIAIEDERFFVNRNGFDPRGIARAVWKDVHGGDAAQGGSTITQQLVRNLGIGGLTREKTFSRKIKEIIYANQIARNYSKQQILEMYLNAVYYGSGAYGVQAASETYFGKPVAKLSLAQCALIAGLPQRPNFLSPYVNKQACQARRDDVLLHMEQQRYITPDQYAKAVAQPIALAFPKPPNETSKTYHAGYFVDYVVNTLKNTYGDDFIYQGGIRVYTTLNWQMEQKAEQIAADQVKSLGWANVSQAAIVCMEPQTGYIKAMVGGVDYAQSQYNITTSPRQPGSAFKPVYYTAALDSGIVNENTLVDDGPINLPGGPNGKRWTPHNDNGRYYGRVTTKEAIEQSLNCASVKVMQMVGLPTAIRYARMMGIHSPLAAYMPLALGSSGVSPLEMADVYATIDNGGLRPFPTPIEQITDDTGNVVEDNVPQLETTGISQSACAAMGDMLRGVVTEGTARAVLGDGSVANAHGKTGTTQQHRDTWFDGYTKDLVTVVWAGHPTYNPKTHRSGYGEPMARTTWGVTVSVPMWKNFMIAAEGIEAAEKAREAKLHPPRKAQIVPAGQANDENGASGSGYRHWRHWSRYHTDSQAASGSGNDSGKQSSDDTGSASDGSDSSDDSDGGAPQTYSGPIPSDSASQTNGGGGGGSGGDNTAGNASGPTSSGDTSSGPAQAAPSNGGGGSGSGDANGTADSSSQQ